MTDSSVDRRLLRLLWRAPMALGVAYFALWGCAPMLTAPAPVPVADGRMHEVGIAGGSGWDFTEQRVCEDSLLGGQCEGPQLQAYYRTYAKQLEISALLHGGTMSKVGAGALVRGYFVDDGTTRLGLSGGLGWLYAQVGVPAAVVVAPRLWLYTEPTAALSFVGALRLPVGLQLQTGQTSLGLELGLGSGVNALPPYAYGALSVGVGF